MNDHQLGAVEARFAAIIWENAPLSSADLTRKAQEQLGWKKSTTYTVLKRLCDKGLFENNGGIVIVKLTRQAFDSLQSQRFVDDHFEGSLPAFLAAFTARKKLSAEEVSQLRRMVAEYEEK